MFDKANEPDPTGGSPSGVSAKTQEQPIDNPVSSQTQQRWRDILAVHPAADLFPIMEPGELKALADDIKEKGLTSPIILMDGVLLDGRNRLDAMEIAGMTIVEDGKISGEVPVKNVSGVDPYSYVVSANLRRRHLTAEQRDDVIRKLKAERPELSVRAISEMTDTPKTTVARALNGDAQAVPNGTPEETPRVKGRDGKSYPAKSSPTATKPARPKAPSDQTQAESLSSADAEAAAAATLAASQAGWAAPKAPSGPAQSAAMASADPKVVMQDAPEAAAETAHESLNDPTDQSSSRLDAFKVAFSNLDDGETVAAREWLSEQARKRELGQNPYPGIEPKKSEYREWVRIFLTWNPVRRCTALQFLHSFEDHEGPSLLEPKWVTESQPADEPAAPATPATPVIEVAQTEQPEPQPETPPDARDSLSPDTRDALRKFEEYAKANAAPWLNFEQCEGRGITEDAIEELLGAGLIVLSPNNPNVCGIRPDWMTD